MRQAPPRILSILTWTLLIGVLATLLWLMWAPPAAYAHARPWFQAAFDLVFGSIFLVCGLFYHSWFATMMGVHKAPVIARSGSNRARIGFVVWGLIILTLGVVRLLLH